MSAPASEVFAINDEKEPKLAPPFDAPGLDGDKITLDSLKGKAIILNFWATWCIPCKMEMPLLEQVYNDNKDKGLVIIGANYRQPAPIIKRFISKNPISFPILLDEDGKISKKYGVFALPATFFINREGHYLGSHTGLLTEENLEEWLTKIMSNNG
ncbi:hypothetical protein MNBD_NITROSPINAE02-93 [hydrothermal vent metagenome]|uniref:Thioredoxin domain-containing protein n=1 Tax=hydrothermal vent metagenome TaxID=652676 RepID=A0A3B1BNJ6_9ZZZZ